MELTANAEASGRTVLALRGRAIPVVLPRLSDARLHAASVVMTIHVLGQLTFDFSVSVPQIAASIVASATIEVAIAFRRSGALVWPASAMLTGSGVGLIMRAVGTVPGDHWSWHRWYLFAAVSAASLLTKYLIRWRGAHVFNPSNVGLVAAFLLLGSERVEPLPFRWADPGPTMTFAYVVIIAGGLLITWRLRLLEMATSCWVVLVAGVGVQARAGHCVHVPWSDRPSCGIDFWWVFVTSPEVLVFLFFMLTDPRTVPTLRGPRLLFAVSVGALAAVLIAPQRSEFGAKVGLLAALTIVTAARPLTIVVAERLRRRHRGDRRELWSFVIGASIPVVVVAWAGTLVAAGSVARSATQTPIVAVELPPLGAIEWSRPSTLPTMTVDARALTMDPTLASPDEQEALLIGIMRALAGESQALRTHSASLLPAVNHGRRLDANRRALDGARDALLAVTEYELSSVAMTVARPAGQGGAVLAADASGTARLVMYDEQGVASTTGPPEAFRLTFAVREATDGRILIVDALPAAP